MMSFQKGDDRLQDTEDTPTRELGACHQEEDKVGVLSLS
jgi:hypothetical protein